MVYDAIGIIPGKDKNTLEIITLVYTSNGNTLNNIQFFGVTVGLDFSDLNTVTSYNGFINVLKDKQGKISSLSSLIKYVKFTDKDNLKREDKPITSKQKVVYSNLVRYTDLIPNLFKALFENINKKNCSDTVAVVDIALTPNGELTVWFNDYNKGNEQKIFILFTSDYQRFSIVEEQNIVGNSYSAESVDTSNLARRLYNLISYESIVNELPIENTDNNLELAQILKTNIDEFSRTALTNVNDYIENLSEQDKKYTPEKWKIEDNKIILVSSGGGDLDTDMTTSVYPDIQTIRSNEEFNTVSSESIKDHWGKFKNRVKMTKNEQFALVELKILPVVHRPGTENDVKMIKFVNAIKYSVANNIIYIKHPKTGENIYLYKFFNRLLDILRSDYEHTLSSKNSSAKYDISFSTWVIVDDKTVCLQVERGWETDSDLLITYENEPKIYE